MFSDNEIQLTLGKCERFYRSIDHEDSTKALIGKGGFSILNDKL